MRTTEYYGTGTKKVLEYIKGVGGDRICHISTEVNFSKGRVWEIINKHLKNLFDKIRYSKRCVYYILKSERSKFKNMYLDKDSVVIWGKDFVKSLFRLSVFSRPCFTSLFKKRFFHFYERLATDSRMTRWISDEST